MATAFGGPGARDAFELVTRAVTDGRYRVDTALARPERGWTRERFVFHLRYRGREVVLGVREGFVSEEFLTLARTAGPERRSRPRGSTRSSARWQSGSWTALLTPCTSR